jgi:hypothetical protein
MPAPIDPALKEAIKASVITHGVRPTAEAFKVPVGTIGYWSANEGWCKPVPQQMPATMKPVSNGSNTPSVAAASAMAGLGGKSKLKLAKATAKAATALASKKGEAILHQTGALKDLVTAGKVLHDWGSTEAASLVIHLGHAPAAPIASADPIDMLRDCAAPAMVTREAPDMG